jgi:microcystin-dependent protein
MKPGLPSWTPFPALVLVPVGGICAYTGRLTPESDQPNDVWSSSDCAGGTVSGVPPSGQGSEIPVVLIEAQGWMVCDGRWLEPAKYPALYAVLGTLYGDDGEGRFRIPDLRGLFLRGVDSGAGRDPDAAQRIGPTGTGEDAGVGSLQCDAVQDHVHSYQAASLTTTGQSGQGAALPAQATATGAAAQPGSISPAQPDGTPIRTSSETRPRNVAVHHLIRFR